MGQGQLRGIKVDASHPKGWAFEYTANRLSQHCKSQSASCSKHLKPAGKVALSASCPTPGHNPSGDLPKSDAPTGERVCQRD
ncbi:MAG: hypothetical protein CMM01_12265 [Rhodopirellula sp.]|nr:hypothetical protein [Rhodopirellula sp.]